MFGECPGADRLTVLDVAFHEVFEEDTGAVVEHVYSSKRPRYNFMP